MKTSHTKISITTKQIQEISRKKYFYSIDVSYPQLVNSNVQNSLDHVNNLIAEHVIDKVKCFRDKFVPLDVELSEVLKETYEIESLIINFNFYLQNSSLLSWEFIISQNVPGTAHPNSESETFNYSIPTQSFLQIDDLFGFESNYLVQLSHYCRNELFKQTQKDHNLSTDWIKKGTLPNKKNFRKFCLDETGVIIIFDPYCVGSYSWGRREVRIPYKRISESIRENSVLSQFINSSSP